MATYNEVSQLILDLLPTGNQIRSVDHRTVEQAILDFAKSQWVAGDVKEVDCTNQYIIDNFESDGMGKNERAGWAICNGNNGTRNRTGRVSVGYGVTGASGAPSFTSVGATMNAPVLGGSKDAVVVDHNHEYQDAYFAEVNGHTPAGDIAGSGRSDGDNGYYYRNRNGGASLNPAPIGQRPLTDNASFGQSGENKNMQPYIVTLFIQKI